MKILFDLVTCQLFVGGAQEYVRKVFYSLLEKIDSKVELWVACDSSIGKYAYSDLTPEVLSKRVSGVIDLSTKPLSHIIHDNKFDKLFIGCAQHWGGRYDVENVDCPVVCIMHDVCDEETHYDHLRYYVKLGKFIGFAKRIGRQLLGIDHKALQRTKPFVELMKRNSKTKFITVSEFSRYSISFHLHISLSRIDVLWSPERIGEFHDTIEHPLLKKIVEDGRKYILMTNANREYKNARKVIDAFLRYVQDDSDCFLVTIGYPKSEHPNHYVLPYLSESDLINAQKNAYAFIFPSFFEGFGYPAVEAMRWAKPILASNVTSIPEILGNAPIYFSPYYTSDVFMALHKLRLSDYSSLCSRSLERYNEISKRQNQDLDILIREIIE